MKKVEQKYECWYCHSQSSPQQHAVNPNQRWTVCPDCGATDVDMPNFKLKRNKLGGASGIIRRK